MRLFVHGRLRGHAVFDPIFQAILYTWRMATVKFPALMKYYVENQSEFPMAGSTVGEVIQNVVARYPSLQPHLFDAKGGLRRHFNIFLNGVHIRDLAGMNTPVAETDKVILMASAAGG